MSKTVRCALIGSVVLLAAGCTASTASHPRNSAESPAPPSGRQTGHVGDKFTVDSGSGKYTVQLLSVDQQAQPATEFDEAMAGHHLAAAQFRVTAITMTDENSNNNATATGSNEQAYDSALTKGVAAGTNFASGSIKLRPGASLIGWVSFEVPDSVHLTHVQWTPSSGFDDDQAEWEVNRSSDSSPTAAPGGPAPAPGSPGSPGVTTDPEGLVIGYYDAINRGDYRRAWNLGGKNLGGSYSSFVSGFRNTRAVGAQIIDLSGDPGTAVVTAAVTSLDHNGTIKYFRGTYTIRNNVITHFSVREVARSELPEVPPVPPVPSVPPLSPGEPPEEHSPPAPEESPAQPEESPAPPEEHSPPAPEESPAAPEEPPPAPEESPG